MEDESTNPKDYRQGLHQLVETYTWIWRELLGSLGRKKAKTLVFILCIGNIVTMTLPLLFGEMSNALEAHYPKQMIMAFAAIAAMLLTRRGMQYLEGRTREIMIGTNQGTIDHRTNQLFLEKSLGQHLREHELLSAAGMEKGRARAQDTINLLFTDGCEALFVLSISFTALWALNRQAGIAATCIFVIYIGWSLYLNTQVAIVCVPLDKEFRQWNRYRTERWEHVDRVKTNGKEAEEVQHMATWWNDMLARDQRFWLWFSSQCSLRSIISTVILISVMGWNIRQTWLAHEHIGRLFPLFIWMLTILDNVWRLGNMEHRLSWNLPSIQSLRRALMMPPDVTDVTDAKPINAEDGIQISFQGVSHTYRGGSRGAKPSTTRPVLQDVEFTVEPGETVALLGRSGAGKSTIMRLLQRGMDPDFGAILVNNQDLRNIQLRSWLQLVGYIAQQPAVLDGTIRYNLLYGLPEAERSKVTDDELWALMRRLSIDFGDRLDKGLDTLVGRNGIKLSGGESQRLMIGAAVAKRPAFYLIDEATSSLDSTTERDVQDGLSKALVGNIGALIIAHRLSTVRQICTKFIVLRRTDEIKDGESQIEAIAHSFEELHRVSPTFRQLAHDQGIVIHS